LASNKKEKWLIRTGLIITALLGLLSLFIGSYHMSLGDFFKALVSLISPGSFPGLDPRPGLIILELRLPRTILALIGGAALAVSGASLQGLFRNPLVFEFSLGISYGAAFGAALSLIFLGRAFPAQPAAFVFAVVAVLMAMLVSRKSASPFIAVLLGGIIVSALFQALLSLVEFFADPYSLQSLVFWLMGSLGRADWKSLAITVPFILVGIAVLILLRWRINVLSLGEEEARGLAVNVTRDRVLIIVAATLATASVTALTGVINWVGLVVPHLVRMAVGPDNRKVIPLSALFGAMMLLGGDLIVRSVASFEIPIGILTSLVGIPFFIVLLRKSGRIWR